MLEIKAMPHKQWPQGRIEKVIGPKRHTLPETARVVGNSQDS